MALLTKAEFCIKIGWLKENAKGEMKPETNKLSVMTNPKRRKVILTEDDMIDTEHPTNKAFMAKVSGVVPKKTNNKETLKAPKPETSKAPKQEIPKSPKTETPKAEQDDEPELDEDGIMPLHVSDKLWNHSRALKVQSEAILAKVKVEKESGTLIPTDLIIPLFQTHSQQILVAMSNMVEDALRVMCKKYDISIEDRAEIKGNWTLIINKTLENAKEGTKKQLKTLLAS